MGEWEFGSLVLLEKREMGRFLWRSELVGTLLEGDSVKPFA
jgi:hypothetical protein